MEGEVETGDGSGSAIDTCSETDSKRWYFVFSKPVSRTEFSIDGRRIVTQSSDRTLLFYLIGS